MNILFNNQSLEFSESFSITELLRTQGIEPKGIAVAVNNRVVPRSKWEETAVNDGDKVTMIRATCGG